jgi:hypothetical protein
VSQCVTAGAGTATSAEETDADRLRKAVLAGPGAATPATPATPEEPEEPEAWLLGAVDLLADRNVIDAGLARAGHVDQRSLGC